MASILTNDDLLTPEQRRQRQQAFLGTTSLSQPANTGAFTGNSRAFDRAAINQAGSPFFEPDSPLSADTALQNPAAALSNAAARFGLNTDLDNPFIKTVRDELAPGLELLFLASPEGAEGNIEDNFLPFVSSVMQSLGLPGGKISDGPLFGFEEFRSVMNQLQAGGVSDTIQQRINSSDPKTAYDTIRSMLIAGTMGTTSGMTRAAMLDDLDQKFADYQQLLIASGGTAIPFGQFLMTSGWVERWFR